MGYLLPRDPSKLPVKTTQVIERTGDEKMQIQLIRHATVLISASDKKILVDPFLAEQGSLPPFPVSTPRIKNPLAPLPINATDLADVDAVIITHYHVDHFDEAAKSIIQKDTLIFCQPADEKSLKSDGFTNITAITSQMKWQGFTLSRFEAHHGFGILGTMMGASSSFAIETSFGSVFITGDAVYDDLLKQHLQETTPDIVIANAGSAAFLFGSPITMGNSDIEKIAYLLPEAKIIVDHMDAVNHCQQSRAELKEYLAGKDFIERVLIPEDGEVLTYQSGLLQY